MSQVFSSLFLVIIYAIRFAPGDTCHFHCRTSLVWKCVFFASIDKKQSTTFSMKGTGLLHTFNCRSTQRMLARRSLNNFSIAKALPTNRRDLHVGRSNSTGNATRFRFKYDVLRFVCRAWSITDYQMITDYSSSAVKSTFGPLFDWAHYSFRKRAFPVH